MCMWPRDLYQSKSKNVCTWGQRTSEVIFRNWVPSNVVPSLLVNPSLLGYLASEPQVAFSFCILRAGITGIHADPTGFYVFHCTHNVLTMKHSFSSFHSSKCLLNSFLNLLSTCSSNIRCYEKREGCGSITYENFSLCLYFSYKH